MPVFDVTWITFDMGGTLLFPQPSVGEVYAEILSRHGHAREPQVLEEAFMRIWKADVQQCLPEISAASEKSRWRSVVQQTFAGIAPLDLDLLFEDLWIAFGQADRWRLPEQTLPTLETLRNRGYRLAVLSNWDERLRPLLEEVGIAAFFEHIFVSCELGCEKPDPRIFTHVEGQLGVDGSQILHIGDSFLHDVKGARSRGWHVVQAFCEIAGDETPHRISSLPELLASLPHRNSPSPVR
jgi:putative hydrolase of the HAD superfamily